MSSQQSSSPAPAGSPWQPRAHRADLGHAVMCRFAGQPEFTEVACLNISQSGMLLCGGVAVEIGADIEFKFVLDSGIELLAGMAKVMRQGPKTDAGQCFGVAFSAENPPNPRILARVIELRTEPDSYDD